MDPVDLDAFLHGGTTAPTRGLQALRWISKNAQLQWVLPELRRVKQPKAVGEQQAMVVEPPLLSHLEDRISARVASEQGWFLQDGSEFVLGRAHRLKPGPGTTSHVKNQAAVFAPGRRQQQKLINPRFGPREAVGEGRGDTPVKSLSQFGLLALSAKTMHRRRGDLEDS